MMNMLFGFKGRIGRGSWWLAQLIAIPVLYLFGFAALAGVETTIPEGGEIDAATGGGLIVVLLLVIIVGVWINVATTVKRFHDRGKSGAWFFIVFIPFIGGIWQLIECGFCTGDDGDNLYGPPGGSGRLPDEVNGSGLAAASNGNLAKLDDAYFRNYAAQSQRLSEPMVQSTYNRPAATVTSAPAFGSGKPVFGRR